MSGLEGERDVKMEALAKARLAAEEDEPGSLKAWVCLM